MRKLLISSVTPSLPESKKISVSSSRSAMSPSSASENLSGSVAMGSGGELARNVGDGGVLPFVGAVGGVWVSVVLVLAASVTEKLTSNAALAGNRRSLDGEDPSHLLNERRNGTRNDERWQGTSVLAAMISGAKQMRQHCVLKFDVLESGPEVWP